MAAAGDATGAPIYQPFDRVTTRLHEPVFRALVDRACAADDAARAADMPSWMLEPLTRERLAGFVGADAPNPMAGAVVTAELYVLMRAALVLVDLNQPAYAGTTAVAFHAYQLGIPVWGVSDRIVTSPWFLAHAEGVVRSASAADLVYDLLQGMSLGL